MARGNEYHDFLCQAEGFLFTWTDWAVLMWVCIITFNVGYNVITMAPSHKFERVYFVLGWGPGLVVASIPAWTGDYGPSGMWCWIEGSHLMRFLLWYAPMVLILIGLFVSNSYVFRRVHAKVGKWRGTYRPEHEAEDNFLVAEVQTLKYYPVVYLVCIIVPLIDRIQNAMREGTPVYELVVLHVVSDPLIGIANAIVYGVHTDRDVWWLCTPAGIERACSSWCTRSRHVQEYQIVA